MYKHIELKNKLSTLKRKGWSLRAIAEFVKVSHTTLSRELAANKSSGTFSGYNLPRRKANIKAKERRRRG